MNVAEPSANGRKRRRIVVLGPTEIVILPIENVFPVNNHIIVSIGSIVFVEHSEDVKQLVNHNAVILPKREFFYQDVMKR